MLTTKTGALVCVRPDPQNEVVYQALAFITDVPGDFSDEDFRQNLDMFTLVKVVSECDEVLYRADVRSTSNEVQEEYMQLRAVENKIPAIPFRQKSVPL